MVSSSSNFSVSIALFQCAAFAFLTFKTANLVSADVANGGGPKSEITLAQLYNELKRESSKFMYHHLSLMYTVSSYGDRLYDVAGGISAECRSTARVTRLMQEQLKIFDEVSNAIKIAVNESIPHIRSAAQQQHPLEFVCQRVVILLSQHPHLSAAFDRGKKAGAPGTAAGRPPYSDKVFDSLPMMTETVNKMMVIPEFARTIAGAALRFQLDKPEQNSSSSNSRLVLSRAIISVAKREQFTDTIQRIYERTLDEVVPPMVEDGKRGVQETFWFFPAMLRTFYGYISENSTLKNEIEAEAANVAADFDKVDLDFSKI